MKEPNFSIVIPTREPSKNLSECLDHCIALDYASYEIIVLPDHEISLEDVQNNVRVIPTDSIPPSAKRDLAIPHAKGEILAFIDDDAYPRKDWLRNAATYFEDANVAAVGGPAVTPDHDNIRQKASGYVLASSLGSGINSYRYTPKKKREVDDYPTCNLLVRKSVLKELGGFDTNYWPGEDTKLCFEIIKKLKMKILYVPDVLVYHHRRELFRPHLKQIWSYAVHRGFFAKKFPETSLRLSYFLPSILVAGLAFGIPLSIANHDISTLFAFPVFAYLLMALIPAVKTKSLRMAILVFLGIIFTHICYGMGFLRGLLARRLKR